MLSIKHSHTDTEIIQNKAKTKTADLFVVCGIQE